VYFGPIDGPNLLWVDRSPTKADWMNYGGDKLWTAPQSDWGWPPIAAHDGKPHAGKRIADQVVLVSEADARGLYFRRLFRLEGHNLQIRNELVNSGAISQTAAIWQITQVPPPSVVRFGKTVSQTMPNGWNAYPTTNVGNTQVIDLGNEIRIVPSYHGSQKYGAASEKGRLTAGISAYWLHLTHRFQAIAPYPDDGRAQQIFISASPRYVELEVNSPVQTIPPGGKISMDTMLQIEGM
jgi:hypothetical protein